MSDPLADEKCDLKTSAMRVALRPIARIFQNEVSFILVAILILLAWGGWSVALKIEEFVKTQIPIHIDAIKQGNKDVSAEFIGALKQKDEHYTELRKLDNEQSDRIERLATGKRTTSITKPLTTDQ